MEKKFYVSEVVTYVDGTKDSPAIYGKASETEAVALFHKDLGAWMGKENVASVTAIVFDNFGFIYKSDSWNRTSLAE